MSNTEINVHDGKKRVSIWLTRSEAGDAELRERLKPLYAEYKKKKYFVAVFESGAEDLITNTKYLIQSNIAAEAEAQAASLC